VFHRQGGAIDNVRLLQALRRAAQINPRVRLLADSPAASIEAGRERVRVRTDDSVEVDAGHVVIAAGAWSPGIRGLPRQLPVAPMKGQMLALGSTPTKRPVMGDGAYLVPRESETVVGSTLEDVGFDPTTTPEALDRLREAAVRLCPALASAPMRRAWAGLRPATPDMLPIIGADPDAPRVLYACGHSKNGILLAPVTARAVAALVRKEQFDVDLAPFSISRFG